MGPTSQLARACLLAALALGFCAALQAVEPRFFLRDDNSTENLPNYVHAYRTLLDAGRPALVNPHQYLGLPHLAMGQPAALYPPTYLAVAVASWSGDLRRTLDLLIAGHLAAAALGMFFLLRRLGLRHGGDVAGALLWLTAPFLVILARAWVPYAYAAAFVPWSFYLLLGLLERPGWRPALAYGSLKTLFFFTGHPQMLVYSSLFEGLYWLLSALPPRPGGGRTAARQAAALLGAAAWTVATSAPLLLPMIDTLQASFMRGRPLPFEVFSEFAMRPLDFLAAQIFLFEERVFITAGSSIYHLGLPVIAALAYFAVAGRRLDERVTRLALLAVLAWIAASPAWGLAYGAPLLSSFRWPAKFFLFFVFAAIPAASLVFDRLARAHPRRAAAALALALAGPLTVLAVPEWRVSMGGATLERPIEHYRAHLDALCGAACAGECRVVGLRTRHADLDADAWDALAPYLAGYQYATLFGRHHLGGYEPLVSTMHFDLSARMSYTATFDAESLDGAALGHFARWGVGCLLAPDLPPLTTRLDAAPPLRRAGARNGVVAYGLDAGPVVARPVGGGGGGDLEAVPFTWTSSGLEATLGGRGGPLRLAVAPMTEWTVIVDGDAVDARRGPGLGLLVDVPAGARRLVLDYRDPRFEAGAWIAALALLAVPLAWVAGRWSA